MHKALVANSFVQFLLCELFSQVFSLVARAVYPRYSEKFLNSSLLNGGPLSVLRMSGVLSNAKILSMTGMTALLDVECRIATMGNLLCASTITRRCSPDGSGHLARRLLAPLKRCNMKASVCRYWLPSSLQSSKLIAFGVA